jgi:magnesium-transporting ATPase (P-type)
VLKESRMFKFAKITAREVLEHYQSDSEYGLSTSAVVSLKKIHGLNKLAEEEKVRNDLISISRL